VNIEPDLAIFESNAFDFIFSTIVLQHNPPDSAERYIEEFCRILAPGGVAVFDMTASLNVKNLPENGHRAQLVITSPVQPLRPGAKASVDVTVTNISGMDWPAGCWLSAGNHWRSTDDGAVAIQDDGRVAIHEGLAAGRSTALRLEITAPQNPGSYALSVDLVEEQVSWFADLGSAPTAVDVVVRPPDSRMVAGLRSLRRAKPAQQEPAPFSMNGLPRDRVESAVARAGCSIADVMPVISGGFHWDGYRYFVAKA